uniref:Uncharacterized protein n=1 Tax=Oryza rufipogon TaxID=4529 RepID=A0A0E0QP45_ORYRU
MSCPYDVDRRLGEQALERSPSPILHRNQPYGNNEDDGGGVVRISDEVDAAEIQLQEVIMSSAMAATAAAAAAQRCEVNTCGDDAVLLSSPSAEYPSSSAPQAGGAAAALTLVASVVMSSCSSSAMAPSVPTTSFLFCKICMEDVPTSHVHSSSHGSVRAFFFCAAFLASHITA